ncbi:MAG: UxaA family hydrolase [Dehalococcoidales bacterium]|nr:UxaA family hydrolase [Dehalococcoidales bacterium]
MLKSNALKIHQKDNVAIATQVITGGATIVVVGKKAVVAAEDIMPGHKIALTFIGKGNKIFRYGEAIAETARDIKPGEWVHVHNTKAYPR